jgi:aspartate/methionine/tyrosine aminotransferase
MRDSRLTVGGWRRRFVKKAAVDAINANCNQYTRPGGHVDYVGVLADMYSPLVGRALDPMTEIVTFNGAQEGIASILASLVEPVRTATASASSASDNQE